MDTYETTIYAAVLITAILVGIIILFFVWAAVRSQRLYYQRRKKLFVQEITTLEEDRKRIAHDLHDELGPELAITKMQIQRVAKDFEGVHHERLNEAADNIEHILKRMGAIAKNLSPRHQLKGGLKTTLQEYIHQWQAIHKLNFVYEYQIKTPLKEDLSLQVFRIVQELVLNSIKHADASVITIQLKEYKERLCLVLSDNGKGFDLSTVNNNNNGLGLRSLKERVMLLGGRIDCNTTPGSGTKYVFSVPLNAKP